MGQKSDDEVLRRNLGEAIRQLRTERKLSLKELGRMTLLSYPYVWQIEKGKKSPSTKTLRTIADALGLQAHQLFERAEGKVQGAETRAVSAALGALSGGVPASGSEIVRLASGEIAWRQELSDRHGAPDQVPGLGEGLASKGPAFQLAQLAQGLSPEDVGLLIAMARRLREVSPGARASERAQ